MTNLLNPVRRRGTTLRLLLSLLLALAGASSLMAQDVTVEIQAPLENGLSGSTLEVTAKVTSVWDIASVKAKVEGRETSLSLVGSVWKGSLSLTGLAPGPHVLNVTAQDVNTTIATDEVTFRYDTLPVIELTEPLEASVARPLTRVVATCEDDDPVNPCKITVRASGIENDETLAIGYGSIDEYVSLDAFDGQQVNLIVTGTDSAGQAALAPGKVPPAAPGIIRVIYVDASSRLEHVLDVPGVSVALGSGPEDDAVILDIDADRILYVNANRVPVIRDRGTGIDSVISLPSAGYKPRYGYLTSRGAILLIRHSTAGDAIFEWQDSAPILHGTTISENSLKAAGQYAIWMGPSLSPHQLYFRDIVAGTTTLVDVGETPGHTLHDVDDDGTVAVWTADYDIYLWDAGVVTPVATANATTRYLYPVLDGTTTVYRKQTCCTAPLNYSIIRNDSGVETELAPPTSTLVPLPGTDYQVNNGWAAFTKPGASGERKVYRAFTGGATQQMSFLTVNSFIETLAPDGTVVFTTLTNRYFGSTAPPLDRINSERGKTHLIDGVWHLALGRSLFLIGAAGTPTTISLTSSSSSSNVGDTVTFTATVSETAATGLVVFKDPTGGVLGSATLSGGTAVLDATLTSPGEHSIIAVYGGDDDFAWSASAPITQTVNGTSTTTLTSSPNPSVFDQWVTFTATVMVDGGGNSTGGGNVQFRDGATVIGQGTVVSGVATLQIASLSVGTHSITAVFLGNPYVTGSTSNVVIQEVLAVAPPAFLMATATSTSSVALTWQAVTDAHHYDIARSVNDGPFAVIASPAGTSYTDTTVSPNLTYLYQVRAVHSGGGTSLYSAVDPATTVMFNRDPLVAGQVIKAVDILELRTAVNAMRVSAGLTPMAPSPAPTVGSPVKAIHIQELRVPLNEARTAIGLGPISFTDPTLTGGIKVKAAHVQQLRIGCK